MQNLHQAICNLKRITSAEWISIYLLVSRIEERINFFSFTISKIYNSLLPVHNYLSTFKSNYQNKYEYATYLTCQNRLYSVMNQWHLVWFGNAQYSNNGIVPDRWKISLSQKMLFFTKNVIFSLHNTYNSFTLLARFPDNPRRIRVASGFEFSVCLFVCL